MDRIFNALFVSRRNSARSPLAAALLNSIGKGRFRAFSAGVQPARSIDPVAVEVLEHAGITPSEPVGRHCDEFTTRDAPRLDFVFTLSDKLAGEAPPECPGQSVSAHWRCEDPARFPRQDPEHRLSLIRSRSELERRLRAFINLPVASLDRLSQQHAAVEASTSRHRNS